MGRIREFLGLAVREDSAVPPPGVTPPSREEDFTVEGALTVSTVYRAITILATAGSQLTLDAWRGEERLDPKPALIRKPDPDPKASLSGFIESTITSMATSGNAYWRIDRNARNEAVSARILNPWECHPGQNGTLEWAGRKTPLKADEFMHLRLLRLPGHTVGLGPIQAARAEIQGARDLRDYAAEWFRSGDVPSGVLSTDQPLSNEQAQRYKTTWHQRKAHEVAVLGQGLSYEPTLLNPKDAQFLESREFTTTDLARLFGIPAHMMLAAVEGTSMTYTNVSQADLAFVRWTLAQYFREIEEAFSTLLPGIQTARFNLDGLLRPDIKTRYDAHKVGIDAGWLFKDEVRDIEGLPKRAIPEPPAPPAPTEDEDPAPEEDEDA